MRYNILGRSGLYVSELCLGTMTFGEDWKFGASKDVSRAMFDAFCEAGGNFIDTAKPPASSDGDTILLPLESRFRLFCSELFEAARLLEATVAA